MDPTGTSDAPEPATSRGNGLSLFALALAVVAFAGGAVSGWQWWQARTAGAAAEARHAEALTDLGRRVDALTAESAALARRAQSLERRLTDAEGVARSVREEVLGLGERARMMEDAVARLADRRLSGTLQLRLDEAEFLLRMGAERLQLFDDPAGAVQAFRLADAELAALDDPVFAGIRQAIGAEIAAINAVPAVDVSSVLATLDALADRLATLPARAELARRPVPPPAAESGWIDRALAVLGQFVRIQRITPGTGSDLAALDAQAARAALAIEFAAAKAAALSGRAEAFRAAVERARATLGAAFAETDPDVQAALAQLADLADAALAPEWPAVGQPLAQLRNLRATRALGAGASP